MEQNNIFLDFWKKSIITFWDLNINPYESIVSQVEELKEDLVQVNFQWTNYILDIWYYPSFSVNWLLLIKFIKNKRWDKPLERIRVMEFSQMQGIIDIILEKYNLK